MPSISWVRYAVESVEASIAADLVVYSASQEFGEQAGKDGKDPVKEPAKDPAHELNGEHIVDQAWERAVKDKLWTCGRTFSGRLCQQCIYLERPCVFGCFVLKLFVCVYVYIYIYISIFM